MKRFYRIRKNEEIRMREVRVTDSDGESLGVISRDEALRIARSQSLDLIEISPTARPPVCKIDDYGSFMFNKKKEDKKRKQASKQAVLKSIRFGIRISAHDMEVKTKQAKKFLEKNHPVKILLQFRGREAMHADLGLEKMNIFVKELEDVSTPESAPKRAGNRIMLILKPEKAKPIN